MDPTQQTLFEEGVPLCIHNADREDTHSTVSVKIDIATRTPAQRKVLHVQLTDDSDPFFFFSLDLTEEDFQGLKNEQNPKPDFANFPAKMIELLQHCIACARERNPSFTAELTNRNNQSTLQIIKTDDFKNLITLSLIFRPGNDAAIKKYLAGKLSEFKNSSASLKMALDDARTNLTRRAEIAEGKVFELTRALDERVSDSSRSIAELRAEMASNLAAERERMLVSSQDLARKNEEDRKALVAKYDATNNNLTQTIRRLETENKDLLDAKYRLESDVKDLTAQLHSSKLELSHCRQELTALRAENKALGDAKHEHEKNVTSHKVKISAVEQHMVDKDELIQKMSALLESSNAQKSSVEESLSLVKNNAKELEEKVAALRSEIKKGNQIIATLQSALKASKTKSAKKGDQVQKLLADLSNKDSQIVTLQGENARAQAQKETAQKELEIVHETEGSLKRRLEECKQVISNNNNVIEFLQKELLRLKEGSIPMHPERERGGGGFAATVGGTVGESGFSSSYKFRPKYTSPLTRSFGYSSATNGTLSSSTSSPPNFSSPLTSQNSHAIPLSSASSTTNTPYTTPAPPSFAPSSSSSGLSSSSTPSSANTPISVVYNPPASQRRSFVK